MGGGGVAQSVSEVGSLGKDGIYVCGTRCMRGFGLSICTGVLDYWL